MPVLYCTHREKAAYSLCMYAALLFQQLAAVSQRLALLAEMLKVRLAYICMPQHDSTEVKSRKTVCIPYKQMRMGESIGEGSLNVVTSVRVMVSG